MNRPSFSSPGYTGYGSALQLSSANSQYVLVSRYKNMTYTSFTWELWVYPTTLNSADSLMLGMCQAPAYSLCLYLMMRASKPYFAFYGNDCAGRTIVTTGEWHHFAFVYDYANRIQYIYYDGVIECTATDAGPFLATQGAITIGAINNTGGATPGSYWNGLIDQVSYVSRAKNSTEVLRDATLVAYYSFDTGLTCIDSGPNGINGVVGGTVSSINGRVNQALQFNAAGSYFQASGFTLIGQSYRSYSLAFWIMKTSGGGMILYMSSNPNTLGWCVPFVGLNSAGNIISQGWTSSSEAVVVTGPTLSLNVWTHIVSSYSSTNGVRLWVNGALIGATGGFVYSSSGVPNSITIAANFAWFSNCATGNISLGQLYGAIDEFHIYSRELSASDVYSLANP
ncbi:unnamed protein product [Rotaria magnacalcarata]|uniref:Uncharacterized protein n=1 Tax=Rotaria magnacalcarata TaxID=392030 RepID=A0A816XRK4_9BILA|nr:unnamed protein product [Rotaria magnacalcarata]CAF4228219.1 unnamed protein product [Rotaria magnacalcarata]